ncbi:hypothetical protein WJX81_001337 [Elliptochloris bilobata]|uniref:CCAAT-binding factor domain-containing protein n=1 Tax=Elliptochloris bilobata TaxID=381761 RepID=A0AAW1QDT9_9CHLO
MHSLGGHSTTLPKPHFKAPEGRYELVGERLSGLCNFNASRVPRLTLAELARGDEAGCYLLFSIQDALHVCRYTESAKQPLRSISFGGVAGVGAAVLPTCHDFNAAGDSFDLLVGLSTGDIVVGSLRTQLQSLAGARLATPALQFNADGAVDATRAVAAQWVPRMAGAAFVVGHASGYVYLYHKAPAAGEGRFSAKNGATGRAPVLAIHAASRGITALAVSPDGMRVATAGRDGVLRVHDLASGALITGFKSYYGSLTCCAWSGDGRYVAAGGEDDLVAVFGLSERCVVAWGEGLSSFISAVAFDRSADEWEAGCAAPSTASTEERQAPTSPRLGGRSDTVYRLGAVGQDCRLGLWDIAVPGDDFLAGLPPLSPRAKPAAQPPAAQQPRPPEGGPRREGSPMRTSRPGSPRPEEAADGAAQWGAPGRHLRAPSELPPEIAPPAPRADMVLTPPTVLHRAHTEPLSDLLFTCEALFTICYTGQIRKGRAWNEGAGPPPGAKQAAARPVAPAATGGPWYEEDAAAALLPAAAARQLSEDEVEAARVRADAALNAEREAFEREQGRHSGQDARWLSQVRRSGTAADRVAAATLLLQERTAANLDALDELLGWVSKRSGARAMAGQAIDALREIFIVALLPDRKLRFFEEQPLARVPSGRDGNRTLLLFLVEDAIKKRYAAFVGGLEEASRGNLDFLKDKALRALADLLRAKPEAEARLLAALVNKLGDPSRKLASKAGYLLAGVLEAHPGMKLVAAREVERFMFRPGLAERARYYAVVFLNQMPLSHSPAHGGTALAQKLLDVYLSLFQLILDGRLGHAAEAAAARFAKAAAAAKGRHRDRQLGGGGRGSKGGRGGGRNGGRGGRRRGAPVKPALPAEQAAEVDARMLGALLAGVRRALPYLGAGDAGDAAVGRHADALFRMLHVAPFGVRVQALALLQQLLADRGAMSDRFYRALYATLLAPELPGSTKAAMFLSLMFRAVKDDVAGRRVAAFLKRLLQVALAAPPNLSCGCLLLTSEILKERQELWSMVQQPEEGPDDLERFVDAPDPQASPAAGPGGDGEGGGGGGDEGVGEDGEAAAKARRKLEDGAYDMHKREPLYAHAERSCLWELTVLAAAAHPSVAAMARALLAGAPVVYSGDPLRDLSLTAFLDKFVQRKPKAHGKGASAMQPLRAPAPGSALAAVGSAAFEAMAEADVAPEAVFLHRFAALRAGAGRGKKGKKKAKGAEEGALSDSEGEAASDSDAEMDAFLDAEEDSGGEGPDPDAGFDYAQLAEAMGSDSDDAGAHGGDPGSAADSDGDDDLRAAAAGTSSESGGERGERPAGGAGESSEEDIDVFDAASASGSSAASFDDEAGVGGSSDGL